MPVVAYAAAAKANTEQREIESILNNHLPEWTRYALAYEKKGIATALRWSDL